MRILFTVGSLSGGGAERVVSRLASSIAELGHEVSIVLTASNIINYDVSDKVDIQYVAPSNNTKGLRFISRAYRYRRTVQKIQPDVIVSFTVGVNIFVLFALMWTKHRVVISERNNPYVDPTSSLSRIIRDVLYHRASGVVFQTEDARRYFCGKIQRKSTIIINPIDGMIPNPFNGVRDKTIVAVGRLEKQKNHRLLLDAFSLIAERIPAYQLHIYGKGELQESLQAYVADLGLDGRVDLKGYCNTVLDEIVTAGMYVLPSDYEGMSNSLLEAMAMGLPVVSTDHPIGGARQLIVSGVNGILVKVGAKEELADAMLRIILDTSFATNISKEAVKVKEKTSIDIISEEWLGYLNTIVASSASIMND